jgi:hypothetical protein
MISRATSCLAGLLLALTGGAAHPAALGDNTVKLLPSKFRLLQNIGPMRFTGQNRYSDRRLGRSFGFGASGISLTIYVYDYGLRDIPDGPDSVPACEQFERAKAEIESGGNYQNVVLRRQVTRRMRDTADAPLAREALYEFDRNGVHAVSLLWVTAADGYFVKLRLSLRDEVADELEEARAQILSTLAESFAARPARPAAAAAGAQPETSIVIEPGGDPSEAALWFNYVNELLRTVGETPDRLPPCGGTVVPGFAADLAARRSALREFLARNAADHTSVYFSELARIEAAGFLEEYVWHYLRDASVDSLPPADLDLGAFEKFRLENLATHVVRTGAHVRVSTVRALPLDPAP